MTDKEKKRKSFWRIPKQKTETFEAMPYLQAQAELLSEATEGTVTARLEAYSCTSQTVFKGPPIDEQLYRLVEAQIPGTLKKGVLNDKVAVLKRMGQLDDHPLIRVDMYLVVPKLNNYSHKILQVEHLRSGFPAVVASAPLDYFNECSRLEQFEFALEQTLGSDNMELVIGTLLAKVAKSKDL